MHRQTGLTGGSIKPGKHQALVDKAYAYLSKREYSQFELRARLKNSGSSVEVDQVLADLVAANVQSDERFAEMICRSRFHSGKGPMKVRYELQQHQIQADIIKQTMQDYRGQWVVLAEKVRKQKFGQARPDSFKEWARQARFLQQRGFTEAQIGGYDGV